MNAYDYNAQRWIEGEPAKALRIKQITDELALVRSDKGRVYCKMIGVPSISEYIKSLERDYCAVTGWSSVEA